MRAALQGTIFTLLLVLLLSQETSAHHGKEFLLTATPLTPHGGSWFALAFADLTHKSSELDLEPGILYGVTDTWSLELHTHLHKTDGGAIFESLGFEQRFHLLGKPGEEDAPTGPTPLNVGLLLELEKGLSAESHDNVQIGGLISYQSNRAKTVLNITALHEFGEAGHSILSYALGLKYDLTSYITTGVEFVGSLTHPRDVNITPGLFFSVTERFDIRLGSTIGLGSGDSVVLRAAIIHEL